MGRKRIPEKKKKTFGSWYDEKGGELNTARSERYGKDPDYRKKVIAASRKSYREKHRILASGYRVLTSEKDEFVCLKISQAAEELGVPRQSILRYLNLGYFPSMVFEGTKIKFITVDQVPLLKKFFDAATESESHRGSIQAIAGEQSDSLNDNWRSRDESEKIILKEKQRR